MQSAATTTLQSMRPSDDSSSDLILVGRAPSATPPRVLDFEEFDKKFVDVLVDSLKYVATTSGIVIAMYSQSVREYVKDPKISTQPVAELLLFAPLLLWFAAIVGTLLGISPRIYHAVTDAEKEIAMRKLRQNKVFWSRAVLIPFTLGFTVFLYVIAAQIWRLYPF